MAVGRHHFLIQPENIIGNRFELNGSEGHHLAHVARLGVGDEILLLDRLGTAYGGKIEDIHGGIISGIILKTVEEYHEPTTAIHLGIGNLKGSKLCTVVEKGTELGVRSITPLSMAHSVKKGINRERLGRVAESAAKQCGRGRIPVVRRITPFDEWCAKLSPEDGVLTHDSDSSIPVQQWLKSRGAGSGEVWLTVGPEGGYHPDELDLAAERGLSHVSLGPRRLRSETAAVSAIALFDIFFSEGKMP
ncbi:MAG: RsmE family RNA methyltransferase [Fidelibacterota bacterium]